MCEQMSRQIFRPVSKVKRLQSFTYSYNNNRLNQAQAHLYSYPPHPPPHTPSLHTYDHHTLNISSTKSCSRGRSIFFGKSLVLQGCFLKLFLYILQCMINFRQLNFHTKAFSYTFCSMLTTNVKSKRSTIYR